MLLVTHGQRPLLEFLRNLTPQALLATTALLLWVRIDFGTIDLSNWAESAAFFTCAALFIFAFMANMNQFMDSLLEALNPYDRLARRLRRRGVRSLVAAMVTIKVMSKHRRTLVLDFIGSVAIVNMALLVVVYTAFNAARAALKP